MDIVHNTSKEYFENNYLEKFGELKVSLTKNVEIKNDWLAAGYIRFEAEFPASFLSFSRY